MSEREPHDLFEHEHRAALEREAIEEVPEEGPAFVEHRAALDIPVNVPVREVERSSFAQLRRDAAAAEGPHVVSCHAVGRGSKPAPDGPGFDRLGLEGFVEDREDLLGDVFRFCFGCTEVA